MYALFLDDEREPVGNDWVIVRSYDEAVAYVEGNGFPSYVSFDHDLGEGKTGYDFAKWLVEKDMDEDWLPDNFFFYVHSQNPVGAENIRKYIIDYMRFKFS